MKSHPNGLVKTCRKLESGLRLGREGIHSCQLGPFASPIFWSPEEAVATRITKEMIVEKRKWLFGLLNDEHGDVACKRCQMVTMKKYEEVDFTKLGHVDLAATTICNLRCSFCDYAKKNNFHKSKYDALAILKEFAPEDVQWDSSVDFNGGEPTLLPNVDEFIDYFTSRRVRIFFYTNGVKFSSSVYDGLANGAIRWIISSLDAGTPSTFLRLKGKDQYVQVLENLSRYAHAGAQGGGRLAVKYIFCDDNCSDDDVAGFSYAMLAIHPQKVWLTFDFNPLNDLPSDTADFGGYDYARQIAAYSKIYILMEKHGLTAGHFSENHLAAVCRQGQVLLDTVRSEIDKHTPGNGGYHPSLLLKDFRHGEISSGGHAEYFDTAPLRIKTADLREKPWSIRGKRVLLAPACFLSSALLQDPEISEGRIAAFLDRDNVLQGKSIDGVPVYAYEAIPDLNPEVILIASPEQHRADILRTVSKYAAQSTRIAILDRN